MPTDCTPNFFEFEPVEGRKVIAAFDAGPVTSDAGALLLGATDRAIGMMKRFASCFDDMRRADLIEHEVVTLVGQRVFGIALGYEDLNDHDELRHDPIMAVLAGKLEARREDCAPVAGKSTLPGSDISTRSRPIDDIRQPLPKSPLPCYFSAIELSRQRGELAMRRRHFLAFLGDVWSALTERTGVGYRITSHCMAPPSA
jgi:hypothetical protein